MANQSSFPKTLSLMAYENSLTKDVKDDYILRVKTQKISLDVAAIATEVARQQGKYDADEISLILNKSMEVISDAVASGYIVNTPLCHIQPTASGVVMKDELSLSPNRDRIHVSASLSQGPVLRKAMADAKLELFTQPAPVGPLLTGAVSTRGVVNEDGTTTRAALEVGDMCILTGENLKLVGTDPKVGITLTSAEDAKKTFFITPNRVNPNQPKKLQFVLPAGMTVGAWKVAVATQYSRGSQSVIAVPRTVEMDTLLVITNGEEEEGEDPTV